MLWQLLSLSTAFFESLKDMFGKKNLNNVNEYVVAFAVRFFPMIIYIPLLFYIGIPKIGEHFILAFFIGGILNLFTTIMYFKAIKLSDLSLTIPMIAFTPIFLLITSPIMTKEYPTFVQIIGVILVVIGAYFLRIHLRKDGIFAPFKALISEPGPRLMLIIALIWSITANLDKIGTLNSSPIFWVIATDAFLILTTFPIMLYKTRSLKPLFSNWKGLFLMGICNGIGLITQMAAIAQTQVANVISTKRTSVVMSVGWGKLIFKEQNIKERLLGSVIMVAGAIIILLF